MNLDLTNTRAIVNGASRGIGRAIATELALLGATVTVTARSEEQLRAVAHALPTPAQQQHSWLALDLGELQGITHAVQKHVDNVGPFNILVNNTGGPAGGPLLESTSDALIQAFNMHVLASHQLMQILVPGMKALGYGRIINIISTSVKQPIEGLGVSNTIRGAMASWAKTLASELAPFGITVNNVLPGATDTERLGAIVANTSAKTGRSEDDVRTKMRSEIPVGRFALPEEVASAAAFLATPAGSYINGTSVLVDGGRTRSLS